MAPEKSKSAQDKQDSAAAGENPKSNKTATTSLEEDDEFEDFPVDDWQPEDSEAQNGAAATEHLWEESWDDDDTSDDFSNQLREELKKVDAAKRR